MLPLRTHAAKHCADPLTAVGVAFSVLRFSYAAPNVTLTDPTHVPTTGGVISVYGANFGANAQVPSRPLARAFRCSSADQCCPIELTLQVQQLNVTVGSSACVVNAATRAGASLVLFAFADVLSDASLLDVFFLICRRLLQVHPPAGLWCVVI